MEIGSTEIMSNVLILAYKFGNSRAMIQNNYISILDSKKSCSLPLLVFLKSHDLPECVSSWYMHHEALNQCMSGRESGFAVCLIPNLHLLLQIQTDSEELLIIKTRQSLLEALTEHVKANHEYELPEVIALPITGGNQHYLEWIKNNTRD
ncbi:hypothetical protein JRO89_XS07G0120100 [Xanthoceras sorbifolium]|uniref:Uncharacterized protein n=1 Tax=Xanthoceras sorbifolium TaxID=99658 RepID=A0ABQ8HTV8_9ROSI|nr:hypothetical protein JRO89_XS07G0120100 [Xanthoceras sorbifolium]